MNSAANADQPDQAGSVPIPWHRYLLFFALVTGGCFADLATKSWVFDRLGGPGEQPVWWLWENVAGFQTTLNEGALFGMAQGWGSLFVVLSIVAVVGIVGWLFLLRAAADLAPTIALSLVSAGILGNLYDRLGMPGLLWKAAWIRDSSHAVGDPVYAVRDWILVMIGSWPWPTFNIADSLLVCGAILLVGHAFWTESRTSPAVTERER